MNEPPHIYEDHLGSRVLYDDHSPIIWRVSAYAIAVRDGALLMVEPVWAPRWELPGGGVELQTHESLTDAATRECWEETGYRFAPSGRPTFVAESRFLLRTPDRFCHSLMFAIRGTVGEQPDPGWSRDPREITSVRWIPVHTLAREEIHQPHKEALRLMGLM